jgi:hypothetical protein
MTDESSMMIWPKEGAGIVQSGVSPFAYLR